MISARNRTSIFTNHSRRSRDGELGQRPPIRRVEGQHDVLARCAGPQRICDQAGLRAALDGIHGLDGLDLANPGPIAFDNSLDGGSTAAFIVESKSNW